MLKSLSKHFATVLVLTLAAIVVVAGPALASTYSASVDTPVIPGRPYGITVEGESPVSTANQLAGSHTWSGECSTGAGVIGAMVDAWSNGDNVDRYEASSASGTLILNDVIFTSPNDDPIDATLNVHLSGFFNREVDGPRETCINEIIVVVNFHGFSGNGSYKVTESINRLNEYYYIEDPKYSLAGLSGDSIDTIIQVQAYGVPVNTPVGIRLSLVTKAIATRQTCRAVTDFSNTFGFPASGPVFDLPAGVSASSVKGNIVDNTLGGSPVANEPASWSSVKAMFR